MHIGIKTIVNEKNLGTGGNQKRCYRTALDRGADIDILVYPDYQYSPRLMTAMVSMIEMRDVATPKASKATRSLTTWLARL